VPSHPAQAYEGSATLAWTLVLVLALASAAVGGAARSRGGVLLLVAVSGWAAIRAAVSVTWRDPVVLGPFGVAGWIAVLIAIGAILGAVALAARSRGIRAPAEDAPLDPAWPDPDARPRF
jgi:hypothetical protein